MKIGVMQPYFFPYLGYFHLANAVDVLVLTDNYKFTKQSWINRNRILSEEKIENLSIPLSKSSDSSRINEKLIARDFKLKDLRNKLYNSYHSSSNFEGLLKIVEYENFLPSSNLYEVLEKSLSTSFHYLGIDTKIMRTSDFEFSSSFKGTDKILQICAELEASEYINLPGGKSLYSFEDFERVGVKLSFVKSKFITYPQNCQSFNPGLSIIDVVSNIEDRVSMQTQISSYELDNK
jgi:hypothetical protein